MLSSPFIIALLEGIQPLLQLADEFHNVVRESAVYDGMFLPSGHIAAEIHVQVLKWLCRVVELLTLLEGRCGVFQSVRCIREIHFYLVASVDR